MKLHMTLLAGVISGLVLVCAVFLILPRLPFPRTHQVFQSLGIEKPQSIAFQPYWLVSQAKKPYQPYFTNVTYFGLVVNTDGTTVRLSNPKETEPGWNTLQSTRLKEKLQEAKNQHLELSLLVHNSNEASISALLTQPEQHAKNLIADIAPIMREHGFTDLNIDIESFSETPPEKRDRFTTFIRIVKEELTNQQLGTLTIEVTAIGVIQEHLIDTIAIGQIADRVVVMAYDFHYRDSFITGPVAPIGGAGNVREFDITVTLNEMTKKIPPHKIILGIPLYGYEWETLENYPGAPVIPGTGKTASHQRVEEILKTCVHCTKATDDFSGQPYLFQPKTEDGSFPEIFYEDEESLQKKLELAKEYQLGGVAVWAVGYEGEKLLDPLKKYTSSFVWKN